MTRACRSSTSRRRARGRALCRDRRPRRAACWAATVRAIATRCRRRSRSYPPCADGSRLPHGRDSAPGNRGCRSRASALKRGARAGMPAARGRVMRSILLVLITACASNALPDESDATGGKADGSDTSSPTMQRQGDPVAGRDFLINGNYFPCGIPDRAYRALDAIGLIPSDGATTANELGRTGRNAELPYWFTSYRAPSGVDMVTVNCLYCHGGRVDGKLVVGLGNNAQDFTYPGAFAGGLSEVAGGLGELVLTTEESAELARFLDRFGAVGSRIQMK